MDRIRVERNRNKVCWNFYTRNLVEGIVAIEDLTCQQKIGRKNDRRFNKFGR